MKKNILGIVEFLLAAFLAVGSVTVFKGCGVHEGKYMACHWAQNTVTLIGSIAALSALIRIIIPNTGVKAGIAFTLLFLSVGTALVPLKVINLCMMQTMRCHTVFKPAVTAAASVLAAVSLADVIISLKNAVGNNEHKKAYA